LVQPGGVRDGFGQVNAQASAVAGDGSATARRAAEGWADRAVRCR
jgi:hypothetical protein